MILASECFHLLSQRKGFLQQKESAVFDFPLMKHKQQHRPKFHSPHRKQGGPLQQSSRAGGVSGEPTDLIMGRNCIEELLRHNPARICEVFLAESRGEVSQGRRSSLRDSIERLGVPVRECGRHELDQMVQSDSHQGVVARVKSRSFLSLDGLLERARQKDSVRVLALDGVLDPQNVGAILRAAECYGIDAVMWSKNRAAPLGPVVSKVSVGASELVPLCPVANLHRAVEALKEVGVWSVGAVVAPDATDLSAFDPPQKWVLVMGSEGEGIQHLIEQNLDFRVYIKMFGVISSLNVSQATAVFLHTITARAC